jgi:hypothetical protein
VSEQYRVKSLQLQSYKSRLEGLELDCEAVSQKLSYTNNQVECRRLERQQVALYQEMEQVAKLCDQCEQELQQLDAEAKNRLPMGLEAVAVNPLIDRLTPHLAVIKPQIETAYRVASPPDWLRDPPKTLKGIVIDLGDMPPDEQGYSPLAKFVASLMQTPIPDTLRQSLQEWAEQNSQNLPALLAHIGQFFMGETCRDAGDIRCHLMVVVERSGTADKQMGDRYFVKAWFWLEDRTLPANKPARFEALTIPQALEGEETPFTWEEVKDLLRAFLEESGQKCLAQGRFLEPLTIEFFLPSALLNHGVDSWVMDDDDEYSMSEPLGFRYCLLVRSSERLRQTYMQSRGGAWKDKWNQVRQMIQTSVGQQVGTNGFVAGDGLPAKKLLQQLSQPQMIGLKLAKEPLSFGKESAFAAIHSSGTPIAIWLRESLTSVDCASAVDEVLCGCIAEIPERVKQHRQAAFPEDRDCHIGHHLSLLWEDFDRLPPDLDYRMA